MHLAHIKTIPRCAYFRSLLSSFCKLFLLNQVENGVLKPKETTNTMKKKHQYEAPALSFVEMETANMLAGSVNISDEITNDDAVMSKKRKQSIWTDAWE